MEKRRDVFQAIADPTRREILCLIAKEPLNLNSIAENFDMSRPAISQHIKVLDESGLVAMRKKGRQRFCHIRPQKMKEVDRWLEQFRQLWEDRFSQLDQVLNNLKNQDNEE
ncbi:ArsR/SmtB family transcription factor [Fodinibius salsisoli]|uniref:Winged helix-turn-helix transcriptional regulator n=1 Tax=Fodinibius salsisoli TaxID=2820877 RepID=A0ABT3PNA9_9BACT|nr:metalloregulator ArsR/SmtB family transcription factor [Fodinibius salsisoli]MCW9707273.1 winged helix-turn-helix transcriptional regulator [Fodinibius salsisoli]